jgi:hypothetical protein
MRGSAAMDGRGQGAKEGKKEGEADLIVLPKVHDGGCDGTARDRAPPDLREELAREGALRSGVAPAIINPRGVLRLCTPKERISLPRQSSGRPQSRTVSFLVSRPGKTTFSAKYAESWSACIVVRNRYESVVRFLTGNDCP